MYACACISKKKSFLFYLFCQYLPLELCVSWVVDQDSQLYSDPRAKRLIEVCVFGQWVTALSLRPVGFRSQQVNVKCNHHRETFALHTSYKCGVHFHNTIHRRQILSLNDRIQSVKVFLKFSVSMINHSGWNTSNRFNCLIWLLYWLILCECVKGSK